MSGERLEDRTLLSAVVSIYVAPDSPVVMHGETYDGSLNAWGEEYIDDFNDPDFGMPDYLSASDLSYSVTSGNAGLLTLNGDGTYSFDAPLVEATFSYTIDVSYGGTTETAYLDIGVMNFAPMTNYFSEMTPHDVPTIVGHVDLLGYDIDGDPVSLVGSLEADNGTVETQSNGDILYTPTAGYVGDDQIRFTLTDGITNSEEGTIDIWVYNEAPIAMEDYGFNWTDPDTGLTSWVDYFVLEGNSLSVSAVDGLLVNDYDPDPTDQDSLSAFLQTDGMYGNASVSTDGSFTYTPYQWIFDDPNFMGQTDYFYYYAEDRFGEQSVAVAVEVDLAKLKIVRTDADNTGNLDSPYVGERVTTSIQIIGNASLVGATINWTIPGEVVEGYSGYTQNAANDSDGAFVAQVDTLDADDFTESSISFFWIDGGDHNVIVNVAVMQQTATKEKLFNVIRPPATIRIETNEIELRENDPTFQSDVVQFGNTDATGAGVTYYISNGTDSSGFPLPSPPGKLRITQYGRTELTWTGDQARTVIAEGIDFNPDYGTTYTDSPYVKLRDNWDSLFVSTEFDTYLMFKPNTINPDNSIWVPLQVTYWFWSAYLEKNSGVWSMVEKHGNENETILGVDTFTHPEWDHELLQEIIANGWPYVD